MLNGNIEVIEQLSKMSEEDLAIVSAFAKFKMYLTENYGKKIDIALIAEFADLVDAVFSDVSE